MIEFTARETVVVCPASLDEAERLKAVGFKERQPMFVISRQRDETIMIGDDIEVTVVDIRGDKVRLGIVQPKTIPVHRKEVWEAIKRQEREAAYAAREAKLAAELEQSRQLTVQRQVEQVLKSAYTLALNLCGTRGLTHDGQLNPVLVRNHANQLTIDRDYLDILVAEYRKAHPECLPSLYEDLAVLYANHAALKAEGGQKEKHNAQ